MHLEDSEQQKIIEFNAGTALVLAGPGCGKTHILAKRVCHALSSGLAEPDKMLCVTFTNRAAREMKTRIEDYLGTKPQGLFIGNMHRFCLRFLHANGLLENEAAVMDENDQTDYLVNTLGLSTQKQIKDFLFKKAYIYQSDNDHPEWIRRRPSSEITADDYDKIEQYTAYQKENSLIDFDDILLRTYTALLSQNASDFEMTGYRWVQVDEVQDMTPLQLALVERVTVNNGATVLYFGDEQQAIFRFIGAGGPALEVLKKMCRFNILRLQRNYRSPRYLVSLCNELASKWLKIPDLLLPEAVNNEGDSSNLKAFAVHPYCLPMMSAWQVKKWLDEGVQGDIAVLVRTNREGELVSHLLSELDIEHFHISNQDLFHQIPFKTVWSHLAAVAKPSMTQPWARLLYQTKTVKTLSGARKLVNLLRHNAISPQELLDYDSPGHLEFFTESYKDKTIVVFDTETTGLDIFHNDIIQIAALKMRNGEVVPGSEFNVFIESNQPIPLLLGNGTPNPLVDIYNDAEKLHPYEAFRRFSDYIGRDAVLAGHNIEFDKTIVSNNITRRTGEMPPEIFNHDTKAIDSLTLSRLLIPGLPGYRLADLVEVLKLEGVNSHRADDDTTAATEALKALHAIALSKMPGYRQCRADLKIRRAAKRFAERYGEFYNDCRSRLFVDCGCLSENVIEAANWFFSKDYIDELQRQDYIVKLIDNHIVENGTEHNFRDQLYAKLFDLLSFVESDLFVSGIIEERVSVMTIHKAKGLGITNVIVHDATSTFGSNEDAARLLYVAFSRARVRLSIGLGFKPQGALATVLHHFNMLSQSEKEGALEEIRTFLRPSGTL